MQAQPPTVRVGDFLSVADSLRLALELAEILAEMVEQAGRSSARVSSIRRQISRLRGAP